MPEYVCDKCAKVFKQKSQMDKHNERKIPCTKSTAINQVIAQTVEKQVKDAVKKTLVSKEAVTKENLQSFFEELHNILWSRAGLNPEKALEHMTFFFAYRMIELQADALNLPQVCRWSFIASLKDEEELVKAIKDGLTAFRKNPKTKPFFKPHELQKAELVYDVVEQINRVTLHTLQDTDVLGDIFEYMIGRGMSTMSDQGQYFTNRAICRFAFKIAYDIKKTVRRPDGSLCTFADWFCGTGGFVAEYVKGVNQVLGGKNPTWKKDSASIYCQDMSTNSITITLLNLLIVTGQPFGTEKIRNGNTFADPITIGDGAPFKGLAVDYCFMNPPFGGSKFLYSKGKGAQKQYLVNQEIRSIGVEDNDKVSAGVQLAMATLSADGGVCCIVLPEGFFTGALKKIVELRKKIAEEYKIHFVVDIASGAFANTGTKTSMLVFQRGAGKTESVKFISLDEKNLVEATLEQLRAKNYSLNYKQYLAQEAVEVEGFEMVKLGDVATKLSTRGKHSAKDTIPQGKYSLFSSSVNEIYKLNTFDYSETCCIVNSTNASGNAIVNIGKDFSVTSDTFVFKCENDITTKYLQLYLSNNIQLVKDQFQGANHKHPTWERLSSITIPLPSLERQQQIVEAIDGWTVLAQQEEQALKTLEKQVMFQVKEIGRGKDRVKLGDVCDFWGGKAVKKEDRSENGTIPYYGSNGITGYMDTHIFDGSYIITGQDGTLGTFYNVDGKFWASNHTHILRPKKESSLLHDSLFYSLRIHFDVDKIQTGSCIPKITLANIKDFEIPILPLAEQQTLQSDFDEIRHKHAKIAAYKAKAQEAIQRLIPGA